MGRPLPGRVARRRRRRARRRPRDRPDVLPRATSAATPRPDGPWRTGDRVRRDDDGYLYFEGRTDDVIISAGYRIGPFEVESALVAHAAVAEAAVVAAPDEERGSVVRAVVVLRDGYAPSDALARELQDHVKGQTAPYKYPRVVDFADELPKTASGKVKRAALRDWISRPATTYNRSPCPSPPPPSPTSPPSPSARRRGSSIARGGRASTSSGRTASCRAACRPRSSATTRGRPTSSAAAAPRCGTSTATSTSTSTTASASCASATPTRTIAAAVKAQDGPGHALRGAHRGLDRRGRGAQAALGPPPLALHQLRHRVDDGRRPPRARPHRARRDREDRGHLPRPPRRRDGLGQAARRTRWASARTPPRSPTAWATRPGPPRPPASSPSTTPRRPSARSRRATSPA